VTGELLTLPRPPNVVRCRPSLQVEGSCSSVDVAAERHESEWLAVNLAVKSLSINAGRRRGGVGQPMPPGAVTAGGRRPLYLVSRSSDRREWPPFGPPGGGCSPVNRSGKVCSFGTSRPARRLPTRRLERFAGPEDLLWGPHLGARDPSAWRRLVRPRV
jgi:hypothetical protein